MTRRDRPFRRAAMTDRCQIRVRCEDAPKDRAANAQAAKPDTVVMFGGPDAAHEGHDLSPLASASIPSMMVVIVRRCFHAHPTRARVEHQRLIAMLPFHIPPCANDAGMQGVQGYSHCQLRIGPNKARTAPRSLNRRTYRFVDRLDPAYPAYPALRRHPRNKTPSEPKPGGRMCCRNWFEGVQ